MICSKCNVEMVEKRVEKRQFAESGLDGLYLRNWPSLVCPKCEISCPVMSLEISGIVGNCLLGKPIRFSGDEILFFRKDLGLKGIDFAEALGVERETVSKWENDSEQIDHKSDFAIRMMYLLKHIREYPKFTDFKQSLDKLLRHYFYVTERTNPTEISIYDLDGELKISARINLPNGGVILV